MESGNVGEECQAHRQVDEGIDEETWVNRDAFKYPVEFINWQYKNDVRFETLVEYFLQQIGTSYS